MPPFLPRKRLNSTPPDSPQSLTPPTKRPRIVDTDRRGGSTLQANQRFALRSDDSDSSLSEVESEDLEGFEDVLQPGPAAGGVAEAEDGDEDEIDWEDAVAEATSNSTPAVEPTGDLQLKLSKDLDDGDAYTSLTAALGQKKGPSKIERRTRIQAHCMHVQFLMFHNAIRNNWIGNREVQQILVEQLPPGIHEEIKRWRQESGLVERPIPEPSPAKKDKSKKRKSRSQKDDRNERDWGERSQRLESGRPNMSHGDPLIHFLRVLAAYWKQKFRITAPGLRKNGYRTSAQLRKHVASFRNDKHDPLKHGEKIKDLDHFKELASRCEGSRDVGAQLFTALLRGIGIEARMVANLQPIGFGWNKGEQASTITLNDKKASEVQSDDSDKDERSTKETIKAASKKAQPQAKEKHNSKGRGRAGSPIDIDSGEESDSVVEIKDDDSVVDVTPSRKSQFRRFDKDLPFPIYWTEAISPISHTPLPVSPFIGAISVATAEEHLTAFEPRGAKAEKAKQVIAYVIAFSSDGSGKDVTTRYLKKHMWPGRTKGLRMPIEKVPIYNKQGKIRRHEDFDWFKTVMSGYTRRDQKRTAVDDVEDSSDLVPKQPEKKKTEQDGDTLQSLKQSAEFVLERHLRREEALKPNSRPVRTFKPSKVAQEENVYLRADVVPCMSAESWHKHGRRPKFQETPLKLVPIRAVTMTRKREVEEAERATGEKPTQGLYSIDQTEYIIPPPIQNGVIPKNGYGNIDCFVPSMIPRGAVHIPLRGTVRICKKLEIDYAEAVTGFEFGNKMAVPVITGVVVAEENEHAVIDAWEEWEAQQRAKEEGKQQKAVLALWRKMIMGLRIKERVQDEYGDLVENAPINSNHIDLTSEHEDPDSDTIHHNAEEDAHISGGGGFLLSDEEEEPHQHSELVIEHNDQDAVHRRNRLANADPSATNATITSSSSSYPTPVSNKQPDTHERSSSSTSSLSDLDSNASAEEDDQNDSSEAEDTGDEEEETYRPRPTRRARTSHQHQPPPTHQEPDSPIAATTNTSSASKSSKGKRKTTTTIQPMTTTLTPRKGRTRKSRVRDGGSEDEDGDGVKSRYF